MKTAIEWATEFGWANGTNLVSDKLVSLIKAAQVDALKTADDFIVDGGNPDLAKRKIFGLIKFTEGKLTERGDAVKTAIAGIRGDLALLSEEERVALFDTFMDGFCRHCGTATRDGCCNCCNDE